uniref:Ig-like domain-containing protein n=1 Tax=Amphiprion percula TaxID=161767 RepID=A0A3P8S098_AMPPE
MPLRCGRGLSGASGDSTGLQMPAQKLKNQEAMEEGYVTLRCEFSKSGVPVEWRRDAQLLKEGDKYQLKQEGRVAELLVRNLTLADAGEYSCSVGSTVTSADIRVRESQKLVKCRPKSVFLVGNMKIYMSIHLQELYKNFLGPQCHLNLKILHLLAIFKGQKLRIYPQMDPFNHMDLLENIPSVFSPHFIAGSFISGDTEPLKWI